MNQQKKFQITIMCKVLKVDRSSYYYWVKMGSVVEKIDETLDKLIQEIFEEGRKKYGTRPIQSKLLNSYGIIIFRPKQGLLWHTDRGSQYASEKYRKLCSQYGIIQSMSRKGNCWDNAVAESFFHTLKTELVYQTTYETKAQANQLIFEYIEECLDSWW